METPKPSVSATQLSQLKIARSSIVPLFTSTKARFSSKAWPSLTDLSLPLCKSFRKYRQLMNIQKQIPDLRCFFSVCFAFLHIQKLLYIYIYIYNICRSLFFGQKFHQESPQTSGQKRGGPAISSFGVPFQWETIIHCRSPTKDTTVNEIVCHFGGLLYKIVWN